ncbi:MAG: hypothetical protein ABIP13_00785 [Tepidiformaceae bacterium]
MPPRTSGLQRDLNLLKRRWWVFVPFLLIGVLIALSFNSFAGKANAVASMQLETTVQQLTAGGDRGLRVFEAQSMASDPRFKQKVVEAIGDRKFDYARFSIALTPISVADGVSRGVLTVSIQDQERATAERYRAAFVEVFTKEYQAADGLYRERFITKIQKTADTFERQFFDTYADLRPKLEALNLPVDEMVRPRNTTAVSLLDELNKQEAELIRKSSEQEAAGDTANAAVTRRAITLLRQQRDAMADGGFPVELQAEIDHARTLNEKKHESYGNLNNAIVAVTSAQSDVDVSYSFSGGLSGSNKGRIAIVFAVTIIFGLIAIYTIEWLSQIRSHNQEL